MKPVREGSNRLDKTLASENFVYKDRVFLLVKAHLQKSPSIDAGGKEQVLDGKELDEVSRYWSAKICVLLDELRSASVKHTEKLATTNDTDGATREWKLKDDSDGYRVMYREGAEGTPFHTLCLDGAVNGDFTSALCVAWESPMYKEWWPQILLPSFKITESRWLRRIRVGEDLSLIRFKVPWPMAPREVLVSAFELEYFEDELLICLVESVPEDVELKEKLHGFSASDLPAPSSHVRMAVTGGFVMQRVSKDQFFFRTIINMDMKLDLVPPTLINFMSRQVAGQGLKLYQKAVLAASNNTGSGKHFQESLKKGLLYRRVQAGLESRTAGKEECLQTSRPGEKLGPAFKDIVRAKTLPGSIRRMGSCENNRVAPLPVEADHGYLDDLKNEVVDSVESHVQHPVERAPAKEAREEVDSGVEGTSDTADAATDDDFQSNEVNDRVYDDPEVEWALRTLNKMIMFSRSRAGEAACASESLVTKRESTKLSGKRPKSEASLKGKQNCDRALGEGFTVQNGKLDDEKVRRSPRQQSSSGDAESSSASSYWAASDSEIASSQDGIDTEIRASVSAESLPKLSQTTLRERSHRDTKRNGGRYSFLPTFLGRT